MKKIVKRIVQQMFPELFDGLQYPKYASVVGISNPPAKGAICEEFAPKYAVDVRLLLPDGTIDPVMPLIRDVPVAMTGAAPSRGFAALPQPGTVVELAFAYGLATKPFVRSVLPFDLPLPALDAINNQRWQQNADSWQQVDGNGNWIQQTNTKINRNAEEQIKDTAPKIWIGSKDDNLLSILSDFMAATIAALQIIANHKHLCPDGQTGVPLEKDNLNTQTDNDSSAKARLDKITTTKGG